MKNKWRAVCLLFSTVLFCGCAISGKVTETIGQQTEELTAIGKEALPRERLYTTVADVTDPVTYASAAGLTPAPDLSNVVNLHQRQGDDNWGYDAFEAVLRSPDAMQLLAENGFVINPGRGYAFHNEYFTNKYEYVPSFVTVDSMMHTYHLYFQHLLKHTERDYLSVTLQELSAAMYENALEQAELLLDTEWEEAASRNLMFFAVAKKIGDPSADISELYDEERKLVEEELSLVMDASGIAMSPLFGEDEDYSQYKPRGYYDGDKKLETYFRLMMWYGRRNFAQKEETFDRSALLMTLALNDASLPEQPLALWEELYAVTSFFAGESDDNLYYDYYPVITAAYGEDVHTEDLIGNDAAFQSFHAMTAQTAPPQINSIPISDDGPQSEEETRGFRFMGQRFTMDAVIFHNLIYDRVGANDRNQYRVMPETIDVTAVLGSEASKEMLEENGAFEYEGFTEQFEKMRDYVAEAPDTFWTGSLYAGWLDTIRPLLDKKGDGYPYFAQTKAWELKNLECFLGSYTELKHDTVLYSKEETGGKGAGGVEITEYDDRGYVEPEPVVFARLAHLTEETSKGLDSFGMLSAEDKADLERLSSLSSRLQTIAEKELRGELPDASEFDLIRDYGLELSYYWNKVYAEEAEMLGMSWFSEIDFPAALTVGIATNSDTGEVLQLGTGGVSTIYVIVPVDGTLRLATGTVYNYYEYTDTKRLTDAEWQTRLGLNYHTYGDPEFYTVTVDDKPAWTLGYRMQSPVYDYQY